MEKDMQNMDNNMEYKDKDMEDMCRYMEYI